MAKMKPMAPKMVAKKDNTNVARTRVSSELVGDKPDYRNLEKNSTKFDSLAYERGFRTKIARDKKTNQNTDVQLMFPTRGKIANESGQWEAWGRRMSGELNKKALTRDSSIPLAPTQFND
jgi:hypothetical protein